MFGFRKNRPKGGAVPLIAPQPAERKAQGGRFEALGGGAARGGRVHARDSSGLGRAGFMSNPVGFRAVRMIAEAAAALPIVAQDGARRYETHPVLARLARPNEVQGRAELLEAIYGHLLLSGNAYVEAVGFDADLGRVAELHVLRPERVSVVLGAGGWPCGYDYRVGASTRRYVSGGRAPLCHLRSFHPLDDHYGLSPLQAAGVAVDVHNAASHWSRALLENAARPSGAIIYKGESGEVLSAAQYERLLSEMETFHQGARNAGRPMLLEGGLDWKPMGFSPSDMEFHETKLAAAREIAMAFGVPPMLVGIPGDATYANYQEAHRAFYRLTVLPLASRVLAGLAQWLGALLGEVVDLRPDLDQIPALAAERDQHWARVAGADFLSPSEKRHILGLPPVAEG